MTVGVAISTHRRPEVLARALPHWAMALPDVLIVTHDTNGDGVAATKNRGIAALMNAGCTHLFLADDDVWPVADNWADLYVSDTEPHLMHCWGEDRLISDDGHYTLWREARGALLYAERRVIDRVGGMRLEFGRWGGEHREWSRRIHNAGLTAQRYADLSAAGEGVWHALDRGRQVPSTVSKDERARLHAEHRRLKDEFWGSSNFVPYDA